MFLLKLKLWTIFIFGLALIVFTLSRVATQLMAKPPEAQGAGQTVFEVDIPKGKHFFTAFGTTRVRDVVPLDGGHCVADYKVAIALHPSDVVDGSRIWKHDERTQRAKPLAAASSWSQATSEDHCPAIEAVQDLEPKLEDVSRMVAIQGVQIYRIPYAVVNGDTRFILVVIADTTDLFDQLFKVPKTKVYENFKWSNEGNEYK